MKFSFEFFIRQLLRVLSFDDIETREERSKMDPKLYKMSKVFNLFRSKIRSCFEPNDNLSVDETLYPFRGIL